MPDLLTAIEAVRNLADREDMWDLIEMLWVSPEGMSQ